MYVLLYIYIKLLVEKLNYKTEYYTQCKKKICNKLYKISHGYCVEDLLICRDYEFELLITFYIASCDKENGRGYMNIPKNDISEDELKDNILLNTTKINIIPKYFLVY